MNRKLKIDTLSGNQIIGKLIKGAKKDADSDALDRLLVLSGLYWQCRACGDLNPAYGSNEDACGCGEQAYTPPEDEAFMEYD